MRLKVSNKQRTLNDKTIHVSIELELDEKTQINKDLKMR